MSKIPQELKYTRSHEWVKEDGDIVTVGITDYAQSQLTDIVFIDLPKNGTRKKAGEVLLTIESVKSAEDVFSPLDGEVKEVNSALEDKPELVNKDPYANWMVKLQKKGSFGETMTPEEYRKFIGE
ncbi:MAG: glycine cleavage system protein GcvH [Candidatus Thermoplasmatota archaeon]|nr:glycine cleavage system protein GcvH [Candidatus Thermoplasmatota archaeon]